VDDRLISLFGLQFEDRAPIWGYQRDLTKQYNTNGYSNPVASRDFVVIDAFTSRYYFMDPNNCANTAGQFNGTTRLRDRLNFGQYCGSMYSPGYNTIRNARQSGQLYSYTTFDLNDNTRLYGELLGNYEEAEYSSGSNYTWWGTRPKWGAYWDPDIGSLVNLQRGFSPEDIGGGGYRDIMNTDTNKAYTLTLGANGALGDWDYDVSMTRNEYKLTERNWVSFADPINDYFQNRVLGPVLGYHPQFGVPIFRPDYAAFYNTISPNEFASFTGFINTQSRTWDNFFRLQLTNTALFSLPGGDAGLAVVAESGNEGWKYAPDSRLLQDPETLESEIWGLTSVVGSGRRSRYAITSELRLPVWDPLTINLSARYDAFNIADNTVDKPTYGLGIEYRPIESLLFRGKYGTAFRAPSISDTFQGTSGYYSFETDYYRCAQAGFLPGNTDTCTWNNAQFFGTQSGNPDLDPIEADVWNAGIVWAPSPTFSLAVDYYNWDITNEVDQLDPELILLGEYYCRSDPTNTPVTACSDILAWVRRNSSGALESIYTPKVNIAGQTLEAVTASLNYLLDAGAVGNFRFIANYTNNLDRKLLPRPDAEEIDLLRDAINMWAYDAYAKTRGDASVAWSKGDWTTTLYANRIGSTPNYIAGQRGYGSVTTEGAKAGKWAPYLVYNASVNWRALDFMTLSFMVNNLLDKTPDKQAKDYPGTSGMPYNGSLYSSYGRSAYIEAMFTF